jgi:hypothetical protein
MIHFRLGYVSQPNLVGGRADQPTGESLVSPTVTIELLGSARLLVTTPTITLGLAAPTPLDRLLVELAATEPALCGPVIAPGAGRLVEGFIVNRNGRDFLTAPEALIVPGDRLLLMASVAGG